MPTRRNRSSQHVEQLRRTIDCLPVATREAMLEGVTANERIIVGAYVDRDGGVCPMLAAHRCGGRTDFLSFAKSWDRFTGAGRRARRATRRELSILISNLEESLLEAEGIDLDHAIADHRVLTERRARRQHAQTARLGDGVDPTGDIVVRRRAVGSWLRSRALTASRPGART
ncbi:MAG TPA: hypothetical protein VLJ42_05840 [Solirubrobacteraceae bacterium]|nr:hypothetical protein [Solirubrobacteraceae bacterium]